MILNLNDFRQQARRTLPAFAFHYVDGGAEDEITLRHNRAVFDRWQFVPPVLKNASQRDLSLQLGNEKLSAPLLIAPTGYNGMLRYQADLMLARAARAANIAYIQSTVSTAAMEEIAADGYGNHWFQLYVLKDRQVTIDLLKRARKAGCSTLVVSVDAVHFGNRERDKRHYRRPMKLSLSSLLNVASKPGWVWRTLKPQGMPGFGNLQPYIPPQYQRGVGGAAYFAEQMETQLDWQTIRWLREQWPGQLLIKGILTVEDAQQAMASGADGMVLSNHGGRQLDGAVSPMLMLAEIRQAVGAEATILIDSGFRRGTDVVKALALGADAVLIGRPLLYAVAVQGQTGVEQALTLLRNEIDRTLAQLGCSNLAQLGPYLLRPMPPPP